MKKYFFGLIGCFLLAFPTLSLAASNWYGSINAGVAIMPDSDIDVNIVGEGSYSGNLEYDTGFIIGGAIGYKIDQFRIEGAVGYQNNDIDKISAYGESESLDGDISTLAFLLNGYLDFPTEGPLTPYITAGVGYANVEADIEGDSDDDNIFIYQLGVGCGYALNETVTFDLRYSYMGGQDYEYSAAGEGSLEAEVASHNIIAGLRMAF
jgi:opacity protein-like surface antigen